MKQDVLKLNDVLRLLRREVQRAGSQSEWARRAGVNRTYLNKVLKGIKPPSPKIIKALNLTTMFAKHVANKRNKRADSGK